MRLFDQPLASWANLMVSYRRAAPRPAQTPMLVGIGQGKELAVVVRGDRLFWRVATGDRV